MSHAIIGCGRVAPNHVYGVKSYGEKVEMCCDVDKKKCEEFAKEYDIPTITTDYHEILVNKDITSVSICTDHASHAKLAIDALTAGKHVIVEKPMALSVDDANSMLLASKKYQRILMVISQHRYDLIAKKIKELLDLKIFGTIGLVNGSLNCFKDLEYYQDSYWRGKIAKEGGSTLINQAIHTLDLMVWMIGEPINIRSIQNNIKFKNITETEDTIVSSFKFPNEALGTLSSTNTSIKFWESKIEIIGTNGSITFRTGFPFEVIDFCLADKKQESVLKAEFTSIEHKHEDLPPTQDYYGISHKYQISNFLDTLKGVAKLEMEPSEALKTLKVVLEIYRSARNYK